MEVTFKNFIFNVLILFIKVNLLARVFPAYAIAFLISLNLSAYFGAGPLYPSTGFEPPVCKTKWWANLIFLNNLINPEIMV